MITVSLRFCCLGSPYDVASERVRDQRTGVARITKGFQSSSLRMTQRDGTLQVPLWSVDHRQILRKPSIYLDCDPSDQYIDEEAKQLLTVAVNDCSSHTSAPLFVVSDACLVLTPSVMLCLVPISP